MVPKIPPGTMTNMQYRRSRGTDKKFRPDPDEWFRVYGNVIKAASKRRGLFGRSATWHDMYDTEL